MFRVVQDGLDKGTKKLFGGSRISLQVVLFPIKAFFEEEHSALLHGTLGYTPFPLEE